MAKCFGKELMAYEERGIELEEFVVHFLPVFCCLRDGVQASFLHEVRVCR